MSSKLLIYLGSFSDKLTLWSLDINTKKLSYERDYNILSPSWLSLSYDLKYLYLTNEIDNYQDTPSGAISSYSIEKDTGNILLLNTISSHGKHPTHFAINHLTNQCFVSNYTSGTMSMYSISSSGEIMAMLSHISQPISSHIHQVVIGTGHPSNTINDIITVIDLGLDSILQFKYDSTSLTLVSTISFPKMTGPRHIDIHPIKNVAFVINEKICSIILLRYDHSSGILSRFNSDHDTYSLFRSNESLDNMAAGEIEISTCGQFVYASNRDNSNLSRSSISVFKIIDIVDDIGTYDLQLIQMIHSQGDHPRHFTFIDVESELLLLVANKDSPNVVIFEVDRETGLINEDSAVINTSQHMSQPTFILPYHIN